MFRGLWGLSSLEVSRGLYASMSFTDLEDPSSHSSLTGWVLRTCGLCGSGWPGTWNRARSRPGHGRGGGVIGETGIPPNSKSWPTQMCIFLLRRALERSGLPCQGWGGGLARKPRLDAFMAAKAWDTSTW